MNIPWTILISMVASIIGGIIAGLFVIRKNLHDSKRAYASQMYYDFRFMFGSLCRDVFAHFEYLGYESKEMKSLPRIFDELLTKAIQSSLSEFEKWLSTDIERKLSSHDVRELVDAVESVVQKGIDGNFPFKDFISKYPVQASHFSGLYHALWTRERLKSTVDWMRRELDDVDSTHDIVVHSIYLMMQMLRHLSKTWTEVVYYRTAPSWTWRILLPIIPK